MYCVPSVSLPPESVPGIRMVIEAVLSGPVVLNVL